MNDAERVESMQHDSLLALEAAAALLEAKRRFLVAVVIGMMVARVFHFNTFRDLLAE